MELSDQIHENSHAALSSDRKKSFRQFVTYTIIIR